MLPPPAHDSGLERFATPFPCGSFIRYSLPALIGAFSDRDLRLRDLRAISADPGSQKLHPRRRTTAPCRSKVRYIRVKTPRRSALGNRQILPTLPRFCGCHLFVSMPTLPRFGGCHLFLSEGDFGERMSHFRERWDATFLPPNQVESFRCSSKANSNSLWNSIMTWSNSPTRKDCSITNSKWSDSFGMCATRKRLPNSQSTRYNRQR
jgi:hypothetical protein